MTQEREETSQQTSVISHNDIPIYIFNTFAIHNSYIHQRILPIQFFKPQHYIPLDKRADKHTQWAANLHKSMDGRRGKIKERREEKKKAAIAAAVETAAASKPNDGGGSADNLPGEETGRDSTMQEGQAQDQGHVSDWSDQSLNTTLRYDVITNQVISRVA